MKILCISHEYPPIGGGGATACKNIASEYVRAGNEVIVLTAAFQGRPNIEESNGVKIIRVPCKRKAADHSSFAEMFSFLVSAYCRLPKIVEDENVNICQVFFGIPSGPLGLYLLRRYNIPFIIRLGGGDVPGGQKRYQGIYTLIGPILKKIWKNAAFVVSNSEGLLEHARRFSCDATFRIIPNGINPTDFSEKSERKKSEIFRICSVARILERKGLQHMVQALPALKKKINGRIKYTIIGDGPYRNQLETMAKELQVTDEIEITGFLERREVLNRLSNYDVFVCPSYREGMPNVVLEAMASGLPIVMTACEGSKELIDGNGFIIPLDSNISQEIEKAIIQLERNDELRHKMGRQSVNKVLSEFTWERTAASYLELFETVLKPTCTAEV